MCKLLLQKLYFKYIFFYFLLIKESWKKYPRFPKMIIDQNCIQFIFIMYIYYICIIYTTINAWIWLADERSEVYTYFQGNARRT